MCICFFC